MKGREKWCKFSYCKYSSRRGIKFYETKSMLMIFEQHSGMYLHVQLHGKVSERLIKLSRGFLFSITFSNYLWNIKLNPFNHLLQWESKILSVTTTPKEMLNPFNQPPPKEMSNLFSPALQRECQIISITPHYPPKAASNTNLTLNLITVGWVSFFTTLITW